MATAAKNITFIDPVCKMTVKDHGPVQPYTLAKYNFHFCSEGCRKAFIADPGKYTEDKIKKKGLWGRYLDRLAKATGGQAPRCH